MIKSIHFYKLIGKNDFLFIPLCCKLGVNKQNLTVCLCQRRKRDVFFMKDKKAYAGIVITGAVIGLIAVALVLLGIPKNMGFCIA